MSDLVLVLLEIYLVIYLAIYNRTTEKGSKIILTPLYDKRSF